MPFPAAHNRPLPCFEKPLNTSLDCWEGSILETFLLVKSTTQLSCFPLDQRLRLWRVSTIAWCTWWSAWSLTRCRVRRRHSCLGSLKIVKMLRGHKQTWRISDRLNHHIRFLNMGTYSGNLSSNSSNITYRLNMHSFNIFKPSNACGLQLTTTRLDPYAQRSSTSGHQSKHLHLGISLRWSNRTLEVDAWHRVTQWPRPNMSHEKETYLGYLGWVIWEAVNYFYELGIVGYAIIMRWDMNGYDAMVFLVARMKNKWWLHSYNGHVN